ncbi:serine hydrolase domain-containing protein [Photobacterium sp.]|uniref:serine hydrolase domain-containing protein n=1 Tax=Photobacterium sp. TaxID=660 RepID=UPI00299DF062|nr:serine hydrolase domain-containing protein [Photobacterium sp.]MDX1301514.1 serine hydrolase domain-containing protein [Photobacterium sp.]
MKLLHGMLWALIGLSQLTPSLLNAQPFTDDTSQILADYLTHQNKYGRFSGNILIAKGNDIVFEHSVGFADVQSQRNISKNNLFKVGSITKQLTAVAILRLHEQQKLSIDEQISRYFPKLKNGNKITIAMLLNHTSGLGRDTSWREENTSCHSTHLLKRITTTSKTYPPVLMYNYSNAGYHLLGGIIEQVTGVSYNDYITQELLRPLGMKDSSMKLTLSFQLAKSYELSGIVNAYITPAGCAWSAGELISTSRDLYIWSRALTRGHIISPELVQLMFDNQYGIFAREIGGVNYYEHNGAIDGFKTVLVHEPKQGLTVVALSNFSNTNIDLLTFDLIRILDGKNPINKVIPQKTNLAMWQNDIDVIGNYRDKYGVPLQVRYTDGLLMAKVNQFNIPLVIQNKNSLMAKGIDNRIRINRNDNDTTREIIIFSRDGRYLSRFQRIE